MACEPLSRSSIDELAPLAKCTRSLWVSSASAVLATRTAATRTIDRTRHTQLESTLALAAGDQRIGEPVVLLANADRPLTLVSWTH